MSGEQKDVVKTIDLGEISEVPTVEPIVLPLIVAKYRYWTPRRITGLVLVLTLAGAVFSGTLWLTPLIATVAALVLFLGG